MIEYRMIDDDTHVWGVGGGAEVYIGLAGEVTYACDAGLGNGTLAMALNAVRACRIAMAEFRESTGFAGQFTAVAKTEDGGMRSRIRFCGRFFPELKII